MDVVIRYEVVPGKNIIKAPLKKIVKAAHDEAGFYMMAVYSDKYEVEEHEFLLLEIDEKMPDDIFINYIHVDRVLNKGKVWHIFKKF